MADSTPRYETKTVHTVRGLESRTLSKMEQDGWELVERRESSVLRTRLVFRRERKVVPRWVWVAGGAAAAAAVVAIIIGSITEGTSSPAPSSTTTSAAAPTRSEPPARTSPSPSAPSSSAAVVAAPVTDAEVLAAFNDFFRERANSGVVLGRAVTNVAYSDRVVTVTFSPAAAGVSQEVFDYGNPFPNLAKFAATPIAFDDDLGNRIRPAVDTITTIRDDGAPLGTYTHSEILALNELAQ
ncbi:hypothetical protein [Curtobacterium sp. VKM Ac-2922]|uniref:hypothetical protein n=1 Tax=Curtobacterium sp. VKM Ac-2922 TaxID=2929475 RepID=UPI001FB56A9C|nr:hypothetical protein [Curtobacterium sp. VKM Ac-2922]MCJ1715103.1 hypothetical protein [Curtobacterium sp. VKM Ac-2922]